VARLSPDGSRLLSGTYVGGSGEREWISTHNLAVDAHGNAYVAIPTESRDFPTTTGAYCRTYSGGRTDWGVVKISPTGGLVAGTYIGGSSNENPDGIYVDAAGNVLITGETGSDDFPVTASALQGRSGGANDAVVVRLSADFGSLLYSTYLGGGAYDNGRSGCLGADGSLLVTGASDGAGWPVRSACQEAFAGGGGGRWGNGDCIIARLSPRGVAR
jgi:hypothetical protein